MMQITRFTLISVILFLGIASQGEAYTYHWEIDETPQGAESASLIEPVQVVLLDEVVEVASHSASLQLLEKYSVHLGTEWSANHAYSLLRTFESIPQAMNYPYDEEPTVPSSVWMLSDRHIQNDIAVEIRDGQRIVTLAQEAFTYAEPLLAEIEGVRGRFFSKRLHRAVVRFVTDDGADRLALEKILQERYAVSLNVPDYRELTRYTTGEDAGRFMPFKNEELMALASMLEEFPQGMRHTPGLNYLVRRLDGTPHPLYPAAGAVAWTKSGYIEFMESAFKEAGSAFIHRLILHEKAHFLWEHLFDEQLKQDWIELGGWYRISEGAPQDAEADASSACEEATDSLFALFEQDCIELSSGYAVPDEADDWATTKQTEFVSAYAHAHNPDEDMAESIASYIVNPDKLRSRSPAKYEFIQNRIMHGTRYISQIREDLTFEVYNLYPDVVYPGRIIRVDIQIDGKPEEDKEITIELELHQENDFDTAQASQLRIFSNNGSFFDIRLDPIDSNGRRINAGHILRGHYTLSKHAADGYWAPDQITLRDAHGNERHEAQTDFGWKLYIDNLLADDEAPVYVKNSMRLSLREATAGGRPYQILTARWQLFEENGVKGVLARLNDGDYETYSRRAESWGDYDPATGEASVQLVIPDYYPSGTWKLNHILMQDIALNTRGVFFTDPGHGLHDDQIVIDELPASINIKTTNPDTTPPQLDLNQITIEAEPTNPAAPNGETRVDITFRVKDNISGYRSTNMLLRDPQGVEHFFTHHRYEYYYSVYFPGDPTVYKTYQETIILPVGSVPGIWGLAEMTVWDKAQNKLLADFTEIVRFEVETASAKPVAMPDGPQLQQNAPNPFNSQTVIPYFLLEPGAARLEVFALTGQRVAVLNQGPQQAGHYRLHWDGRDREGRPLASGVYLYRLVTPESVLTRKLILLR
ncbi:MAG: T9SS type A sorting domain-containing protein [Gemmatimonadetes bacterium]|nr:T9SS type A sorting domain-containing protein [Gemmatimonadota bacterium]